MVKLPLKFGIETDVKYTNNGKRAAGYNISYVIWNAAAQKRLQNAKTSLFRLKPTICWTKTSAINALLSGNQIVDTKTNIIKRYFY